MLEGRAVWHLCDAIEHRERIKRPFLGLDGGRDFLCPLILDHGSRQLWTSPQLLAASHLKIRVLACIVGSESRPSLIYSFWFPSQSLSCVGISADQGQPTSCSRKKWAVVLGKKISCLRNKNWHNFSRQREVHTRSDVIIIFLRRCHCFILSPTEQCGFCFRCWYQCLPPPVKFFRGRCLKMDLRLKLLIQFLSPQASYPHPLQVLRAGRTIHC